MTKRRAFKPKRYPPRALSMSAEERARKVKAWLDFFRPDDEPKTKGKV